MSFLPTLTNTYIVVIEDSQALVVLGPVEPDDGDVRSVAFEDEERHVRAEVGVVVEAAALRLDDRKRDLTSGFVFLHKKMFLCNRWRMYWHKR
jgi:hypothetical protein